MWFYSKEIKRTWNPFCLLFFHTSEFNLIKSAFLLRLKQGMFWDETCPNMWDGFTHLPLWTRLAATERRPTVPLPIKMTQLSPGWGITVNPAWQPRKLNKASGKGVGFLNWGRQLCSEQWAVLSGALWQGTDTVPEGSRSRASQDAYLGLTASGQGKKKEKDGLETIWAGKQ